MSSKRVLAHYLDLGAQYFTARSESFSAQVSQWLEAGVVRPWAAMCYRFEQGQLNESSDSTVRLVGAPSMQAPVQALLSNIPVHLDCRITRLRYVAADDQNSNEPLQQGWYVFDQQDNSYGPYSSLILALPPVQLQALLATVWQAESSGLSGLHQLMSQLNTQILLPCWAVNLQLAKALPTRADAIFVKEGNISWLARQNSKPARDNSAENWLVHFSPQCSALHLEADPAQVAALAKAEMELIFEQQLSVTNTISHRWLYAQINPAVSQQKLDYVAGLKLAIAGDWLKGGRVENAWLSGVAAAEEIMNHG
jgi:hypothetical protein